jgi:hypothetical protein
VQEGSGKHETGALLFQIAFEARRVFLREFQDAPFRRLFIRGKITIESWDRLGQTLIPKLKMEVDVGINLDISVSVDGDIERLRQEVLQMLRDLNLADRVRVELEMRPPFHH